MSSSEPGPLLDPHGGPDEPDPDLDPEAVEEAEWARATAEEGPIDRQPAGCGRVSEALITTNELAAFLKVAPKTVRAWRYQGKGPAWVRVGGQVRYRVDDVDRWLKRNEQSGS